MPVKVKRIANAFILGFLATLFIQVLAAYGDFSAAVSSGDWQALRAVGFAAVSAALLAALRAIQSYVPTVPSPEADEQTPPKGAG